MKTYLVGGAVRDKLMGKVPHDFDYLVFDTTPEELMALGYQKVGNSFEVFLHPKTREEYSLPRGKTLEEDLYRRDLTINAMAIDENGDLIDPYGGVEDLKGRVLRHVSSFFSQDPLRVLRLFRFNTIFHQFTIAPETFEISRDIVRKDEYFAISSERIVEELKLVLQSDSPSIFFENLSSVSGLSPHFKELDPLQNMERLNFSCTLSADLSFRYAILLLHLSMTEVQEFSSRLSVPNEWREAAMLVSRFQDQILKLETLSAEAIVEMLYAVDAFRKPHHVKLLDLVCEVLKTIETPCGKLEKYFSVVRGINAKDVSPALIGTKIGEAILAKRIKILENHLSEQNEES